MIEAESKKNMKFGVCGDVCVAKIALLESYDFVEWNVATLLKPMESDSAFEAVLSETEAAGIHYPALKGFVPGCLKITGPDVDFSALEKFAVTVMERAERAKVETIVFGSGAARNIPDRFSRGKAAEQLVAFCRMVAPLAFSHGVTVVIEPLNKDVCNVLTTVEECAELVNSVSHPGIRLLVDSYHFMHDNDSYDDIVKYGNLFAHVHISTVPNRLVPGAEPCDFLRFFRALNQANYTGRVSIEAIISDPEKEIPVSLPILRGLAGG